MIFETKIWVPQLPVRFDIATQTYSPTFNLNKADSYGKISLMAPLGTPRGEIASNVPSAISKVDPEDYILCIGDMAICATVIALILIRDGTANLLRWNRIKSDYETEIVTTKGIE